ncbi:class I SAM-dependent methyltransferase [bacterium]|nr:MAG: class I SAM-dependent methyltransferase [bacterium]
MNEGVRMVEARELKACCAQLYSNDWVRTLAGESLHPGGLELTRRLGRLLGLGPGRALLDVACGYGSSALWLAGELDCEVTGVDYAQPSIATARREAAASAVPARARFLSADAEHLPLSDSSFDAVICECSFCTFPDKLAAAREIFRVLRPGGRFGLADLVRSGPLPAELVGLLGWVACIADARPVAEYRSTLEACGFVVELVEHHDTALATLVDGIRRRLVGAQLASTLGKLDLPGIDLAAATSLARGAARAIEDRRLGYALLLAAKPAPGWPGR